MTCCSFAESACMIVPNLRMLKSSTSDALGFDAG